MLIYVAKMLTKVVEWQKSAGPGYWDLKGPNISNWFAHDQDKNLINIQTTKLFVSTELKTPDLKIQVKVEER